MSISVDDGGFPPWRRDLIPSLLLTLGPSHIKPPSSVSQFGISVWYQLVFSWYFTNLYSHIIKVVTLKKNHYSCNYVVYLRDGHYSNKKPEGIHAHMRKCTHENPIGQKITPKIGKKQRAPSKKRGRNIPTDPMHTVHLASSGNPLIEGAYFSALRRATTKLNSLYHPPLS